MPISLLTRLVTTGNWSFAASSRIARADFKRAKATRRSRLPSSEACTSWFSTGSSNCFHQMLSKRLRS
ncbi:hypothetical protein D3C75_1262250 [compost metagenome]